MVTATYGALPGRSTVLGAGIAQVTGNDKMPLPDEKVKKYLPRSEASSDVAQVGHDGRQLGILAPQLPPGTRRGQHRRLEVPDRLSPQNQVLQELARAGLGFPPERRRPTAAAARGRPGTPSPMASGRDIPTRPDRSTAGDHSQRRTPPGPRRPTPSPRSTGWPEDTGRGRGQRAGQRSSPRAG